MAICILKFTIHFVAIIEKIATAYCVTMLWLKELQIGCGYLCLYSTVMNVAISRNFATVNSVAFCGKIAANIVCGGVAETHLQIATFFQ